MNGRMETMHPLVALLKGLYDRQARREALAVSPMPENIPEDYTEIEREIAGLMTESTGADILDSGGTYGRNWQRNRLITDFRQLRPMTIDSWLDAEELPKEKELDEVGIDKDLFHFLTEHLSVSEASKKLDKELAAHMESTEDWGMYGMESFLEKYPLYFEPDTYILGEEFQTFNSYNYTSPLSQVIQYGFFSYDGENFMVLQIHNGADVRGGYTSPRIFSIFDGDYGLEKVYSGIYGFDFWCPECAMDWQRDSNGYTYPKGTQVKIVEKTTGRIFRKKTGERAIIHLDDCGGEISVT